MTDSTDEMEHGSVDPNDLFRMNEEDQGRFKGSAREEWKILQSAMGQAEEYGLESEVFQYAMCKLKITPEELEKALWDGICEWIK